MDTVDPIRFVFASFFVLGLLGLLAVFLKYYGKKTFGQKVFSGKLFALNHGAGRVTIVETQYIDAKSKLLLVKRDDVEHLLLVSEGKATVVESGIKAGINHET